MVEVSIGKSGQKVNLTEEQYNEAIRVANKSIRVGKDYSWKVNDSNVKLVASDLYSKQRVSQYYGDVSVVTGRQTLEKKETPKIEQPTQLYQGPVRPGTDEKTFRETGKSVQSKVYQGPVRYGTSEKTFRETGVSSQTSSQTSTQYNQEIAKDVAVPKPNTIDTAQSRTFKEGIDYYKTNTQKTFSERFRGAVAIAGAGISSKLSSAEQGVSGFATKILRKGGVVESPSVQIQKEKEIARTETIKFNLEAERYASDVEKFNSKWGNKEITSQEEYNKYLSEKQSLENRQQNIKNKSEQLVENLKDLDIKEKRIEKNPQTFAKSLVNSAFITAVTIPLSIARFGVSFIANPIKTTEGVGEGLKSIPSAVAEKPASASGELVGSLIGSYVFGLAVSKVGQIKTSGDLAKAKSIVQRSSFEITSVRGLTSEAEILKLSIPETQKAELISQLKAGYSVRITNYKIKAPSSLEQKFIDKKLNIKNVKTFDVVTRENNIINTLAVGRVDVGGKTQYLLSRGTGVQKGEISRVQTLTLSGEAGKPVTSASKILEISQSRIKNFKGGRVIESKSKSLEVLKEAEKKYLTLKELRDLIKQDVSKSTIRTGKSAEIQQQTGEFILGYKGGETAIIGSEKLYKTLASGVKTEIVSPPIQFDRIISSKKMKTFKAEGTTELKNLNQELNVEQIQIPKVELKVEPLPVLDLSQQIKQAVKTAEIISKRQNIPTLQLKTKQQQKIESQLDTITDSVSVTKSLTKIEEKQKTKQLVKKLSKISTISDIKTQMPIKSVIDIKTPQMPELKQLLDKAIQQPVLKAPNIFTFPKVPKLPFFPTSQQVSGYQRKPKKQKKQGSRLTSKYTSGLAPAFFGGKILEVTPEEYKKLSKKLYLSVAGNPLVSIKRRANKKKQTEITGVNFDSF